MISGETKFDVIILGAGPGGLAAALWCADLRLKALVLEEKPEVGGQLLWTFNQIVNYPGFLSVSALELRERFFDHVARTDVSIKCSTETVHVDVARKTVETQSGERFSAAAIIVATGVRRRTLGVTGEKAFAGQGILSSGVRDHDEVRDKSVLIVGGGDAALENAISISQAARTVLIVHRGEQFSARPQFVSKAQGIENISFLFRSTVVSITGNDRVSGINVLDMASGKARHLPVDKILIRIGVEPNTEQFKGQLDLDDNGYVKVSFDCSTNIPNVYAVGDVANPVAPTIASAVGMGSTAVKALSIHLR